MAEWIGFVDQYLKLAEREVLTHAGRVSHDAMLKTIDQRYASFDAARKQAGRQAAEIEHEREIEAELRQIEDFASRAEKAGSQSAAKGRGRKDKKP